ncbi:NAD-dependent epimerase/dehydratase family protein [Nocardia sp. IFM 10818]
MTRSPSPFPTRPRDIYDETKLEAETLVTSAHHPFTSSVLRIARCFPEPPAIQAAHRLYRGVDVRDVARAHRLAAERPNVTGTFNIAGPMLFHRQGWPLPVKIDRVYDSRSAGDHLGYHPAHGVATLVPAPR